MFFPLFVDLSGKEILVVGAGTIASRRIRTLCDFSKKITVIAPEVTPEVRELAELRRVKLQRRRFEMTDLEGKDMVLAATDDDGLNQAIAEKCRALGIPVNSSSNQALCDFQFPSVVQDGDVVIGLNASGKNHRLVKETRKKVEQCLQVTDKDSKYKDSK
ncbi:MAG: bifunctional precorrin-2 dehydrogenase/sirohydrochlorin ferrochelatase [Lachnospiraceae bacterium]|nr:bifunctional precorrin-2 dehydrogenase/sirohydrochlorin ferrochelatase [Lachnospiraceae bacterium]